jgi:hypothetical protein
MWKRIHSNRDPRDTLYSEIKKEFGTYFQLAGESSKQILDRYPKIAFIAMIILLLTSAALSFTLFRNREKPNPVAAKAVINPVSDGFSRIMDAANGIKETLALKKLVDSLSSKKELNARDSLRLDSALDRLKVITKH